MYEPSTPPEIFLREDGCYQPLCPVDDEYVAGEIVNRWFHREHSRQLKNMHEIEMLKFDAELAELLFRMKEKLSRLGRNGGWSRWLRQQNIQRSTADRLVAQYAAAYGLTDGLRRRDVAEPLESNVCLAASRTSKRLKNMLRTPRSRMSFLKAISNLFGLELEYDGADSIRVAIPAPIDNIDINFTVPNLIVVHDDRTIRPIDYELKDPEGANSPL